MLGLLRRLKRSNKERRPSAVPRVRRVQLRLEPLEPRFLLDAYWWEPNGDAPLTWDGTSATGVSNWYDDTSGVYGGFPAATDDVKFTDDNAGGGIGKTLCSMTAAHTVDVLTLDPNYGKTLSLDGAGADLTVNGSFYGESGTIQFQTNTRTLTLKGTNTFEGVTINNASGVTASLVQMNGAGDVSSVSTTTFAPDTFDVNADLVIDTTSGFPLVVGDTSRPTTMVLGDYSILFTDVGGMSSGNPKSWINMTNGLITNDPSLSSAPSCIPTVCGGGGHLRSSRPIYDPPGNRGSEFLR